MVFLVFMTLHMAPGDPVDLLYDPERVTVSEATIEAKRKELGLDRPIPVQFVHYLGRVLQGDLGKSFTTRGPVSEEIARNFPATLELALGGIIVATLIGIPAGIVAALRKDTWVDFTALTGAVIGLAAPNFWIGILLLVFFGYELRWFPIITTGAGTWSGESLRSLVLPAIHGRH